MRERGPEPEGGATGGHERGPEARGRTWRATIRAADSDREAVARELAAAASQGRITVAELRDRLARVVDARTHADLDELVGDLTTAGRAGVGGPPGRTAPETLHVSAPLRDVRRRGRWRVPARVRASAGRGAVRLDLTEAELQGDEVVIDARPNWNDVAVVVPEGFRVTVERPGPSASPVRDLTTAEPREDAPTVHIIARPGMGEVVLRHPRRRPGRWSVRGWRRP